jgi:glycosyltransferase involved in cell wall biosynthesis
MNLLFFTCWYPNKYNSNNGIFIKEHAKCVKSTGNEIIVFAVISLKSNCIYSKEITVFIDENGIETHILYLKSKYYKWIYINIPLQFHIAYRYYKQKIAGKFSPDIVHSNILYPSGLIGNLISNKIAKPHIITEHWSKLNKFFKKSIYTFYGRKVYNNAKRITVVSDFLMNSVKQFTSNNNIIKIPNVINESFFYKQKNPTADCIHLCAIATWKYPKLPFLIMDAIQSAQNNISKKFILNFIGEGPLYKEMIEKSSSYSFQINFLGKLGRIEVNHELQKANFFMHASAIETFSLVIAEALATGTPVIASKVGAIPELINDTNGYLCENTIDDWALKIIMAINSKYNNEQISEQVISLYSQEVISLMFKKLYTDLQTKDSINREI